MDGSHRGKDPRDAEALPSREELLEQLHEYLGTSTGHNAARIDRESDDPNRQPGN